MRAIRVPGIAIALVSLSVLALGACNYPSGQPSADRQATAAALTVAAELTNSAVQTPAPPATATSQPATSAPAATEPPAGPSPTPEPTGCTNQIDFIADVTVPDDTVMGPGKTFTKTWRLRNAGTCTWTGDYDLVFDGGQAMGAPASVPIGGSVPPNGTVDVSVEMTSPSTEGTHKGNWMLRDAQDRAFGLGDDASIAFWVQIVVGPTPTPEPEIYNTQKGELEASESVDLDEGDFSPSSGDRDLRYKEVSPDEKYLEALNGATLAVWTSGVPSYQECVDEAELSGDDISFDDFAVRDYICFQTDEDRYGWIEIENISGSAPETLHFDIRTWKKR